MQRFSAVRCCPRNQSVRPEAAAHHSTPIWWATTAIIPIATPMGSVVGAPSPFGMAVGCVSGARVTAQSRWHTTKLVDRIHDGTCLCERDWTVRHAVSKGARRIPEFRECCAIDPARRDTRCGPALGFKHSTRVHAVGRRHTVKVASSTASNWEAIGSVIRLASVSAKSSDTAHRCRMMRLAQYFVVPARFAVADDAEGHPSCTEMGRRAGISVCDQHSSAKYYRLRNSLRGAGPREALRRRIG